MSEIPGEADLETHTVENQPPVRGDIDLLASDPMLTGALAALEDTGREALAVFARQIGTREMRLAARDANRYPPELVSFDSGGRRLDEVRFHPAYHRFMEVSRAAGYATVAFEGRPSGQLAHAAMVYLASQVEPGHCCPLTMTYAAIPALDGAADGVLKGWREKLLSRSYDPTVRPVQEKAGATLGMALTEKQGGSDVRSNSTRAVRDGEVWRLTGHKWFCSAPMSDGFLTLANTDRGLSCFLVPRWLEGGRNGIRLLRLKDKLGNRSNASSEIEYENALAYLVGEEGRGIPAIIEMIHHTRLDTALAPCGLMRASLAEAIHWTSNRTAFQRRLIDQPLMRSVLADLALDLEGSLALGLRIARAMDGHSAEERAFARIGVALAKYLANKLCPLVVVEAMETLGGMGYVEDTPLPLLYREAPLNGIWEGSGNVICLDVLRTLQKDPLSAEMLKHELDAGSGTSNRYDAALHAYRTEWPGAPTEAEARAFVEHTALMLAASVLARAVPGEVAEAFVATRLLDPRGRTPGSVRNLETDPILARLSV